MEQKIYSLSEYRVIKAESQQTEEPQPIHRIVLFGHRYIIKQEAWEIYQVINEVLTMLFGVASIGMILFYFLLIAQK